MDLFNKLRSTCEAEIDLLDFDFENDEIDCLSSDDDEYYANNYKPALTYTDRKSQPEPKIKSRFDFIRSIADELSNPRIDKLLKKVTFKPYPEPSELKVSTMSAVAKLNHVIDLRAVAYLIDLIDRPDPSQCIGIKITTPPDPEQYPGFIDVLCPPFARNRKVRPPKPRKNNKTRKRFFNQITVRVGIEIGPKRVVNTKIFCNGSLQMTGVKSQSDLDIACDQVMTRITRLAEKMNRMNVSIVQFKRMRWFPLNIELIYVGISFTILPNTITINTDCICNSFRPIPDKINNIINDSENENDNNVDIIDKQIRIPLSLSHSNWPDKLDIWFNISHTSGRNLGIDYFYPIFDSTSVDIYTETYKKTLRCNRYKQENEQDNDADQDPMPMVYEQVKRKHVVLKCLITIYKFLNGKLKMQNTEYIPITKTVSHQVLMTSSQLMLQIIEHINQKTVLIRSIKKISAATNGYNTDCSVFTLTKTPEKFHITDKRITMINSDFKANFPIERIIMNKIYLCIYKLNSVFGDTKHQGVKTRYKWNKINNNGLCDCNNDRWKKKCDCKEITFMTFGPSKKDPNNSSILITGGNKYEQLVEVYEFINKVLKDHYREIYKVSLLPYIKKKKPAWPPNRKVIINVIKRDGTRFRFDVRYDVKK